MGRHVVRRSPEAPDFIMRQGLMLQARTRAESLLA
jgi:hypothetical protein